MRSLVPALLALALVAVAHVHLADAVGHGHAEVSVVNSLDEGEVELLQTKVGGDVVVDQSDMDEPIADTANESAVAEETGDGSIERAAAQDAAINAADEAPEFVSKSCECETPAETAAREKEEQLQLAAAKVGVPLKSESAVDGATPTPCPQSENAADGGAVDPTQDMPGSLSSEYVTASESPGEADEKALEAAAKDEHAAEQTEMDKKIAMATAAADEIDKSAPPEPFSAAAMKQAGDMAVKAIKGYEDKDSDIVKRMYEEDIVHSKKLAEEDRKRVEAEEAANRDKEEKKHKPPEIDKHGRIETKMEKVARLKAETKVNVRNTYNAAVDKERKRLMLKTAYMRKARAEQINDIPIPKNHDDSKDPEEDQSNTKTQIDKAFSGDRTATKVVVKKVLDAAKAAHKSLNSPDQQALKDEPNNLELVQVGEEPTTDEVEEEAEEETEETESGSEATPAAKPAAAKQCICKKTKMPDIPQVDMAQGMPEEIAADYVTLTKTLFGHKAGVVKGEVNPDN